MRNVVLLGDVREQLKTVPDGSTQTCVTSPPYYGLRDYGHDGQIGLEETPEQYVDQMVGVFREVRRVLRDDGTLWLNIGDSYANDGKWGGSSGGKHAAGLHGKTSIGRTKKQTGLKPKDLIGIPWMLAFALRADGWYLRQDIIWHKPNPMPESVQDRCTKSHEYIFLLTKQERYFYDAEAVKVQASSATMDRNRYSFNNFGKGQYQGSPVDERYPEGKRIENPEFAADGKANRRSVWSITVKPYREAHFATFPEEIPEVCIRAGSQPGDLVLDPFAGSGTTLAVAKALRRDFLGIELNPKYHLLIEDRLRPVLELEADRQGFETAESLEQE